jgi:hypothetical protein
LTPKESHIVAEQGDNKWLDLIKSNYAPGFKYEDVKKPEGCYTIFENAMTATYLQKETPLLKRIIWERELIGMLQCLVLAFYSLLLSLIFSVVFLLHTNDTYNAKILGIVLVFSIFLTSFLVMHLKLRNKLLARDVAIAASNIKNISDNEKDTMEVEEDDDE